MGLVQVGGDVRPIGCENCEQTSLARADDPASTLAGTLVTIGEGVPDLEDTSLPSSGEGRDEVIVHCS